MISRWTKTIAHAAIAQSTFQPEKVLELRRIEVELTKAQKWDGALPQNIYASAPIPFFNAPMAVAAAQ